MSDKQFEKKETHASYGMVGFTRFQVNGARLFGSAVRINNGVSLSIKRAEHHHELSRSWFFGREELIRVDMTEAQFASLLSSLNIGDGVPCTLRRVDGEQIPDPPEASQSEPERIQQEFKKKARSMGENLKGTVEAIKTLVAKLPKRDQEKVRSELDLFVQEVQSNLPFLLESLHESGEKVVTELKSEVAAFVTNALKEKGLEQLRDQAPRLPMDTKGDEKS